MLTYATSSDLLNWSGGTAPTNADQLLRTASILVRKATITATYTVDTAGLPTDADVLQAFKDATCAHAAAMAAALIDPLAGGATTTAGTKAAKKVGTASIEYAGTQQAAAARALLAVELAPEALDILQQAGLTPGTTWAAG